MKNVRFTALKRLSGVLLIVAAIGMLAFWEAKGREVILMDEVLVAAEDIPADETITAAMLATVTTPLDAKVSGVAYASEADEIVGRKAKALIPGGAQISAKLLGSAPANGEAEKSYFVIRRDWIYMCSSALRQGDEAVIVSADGATDFGAYKVAFVKDGENDEIVNQTLEKTGLIDESANARSGGANVDHIEIVTDLADYMKLKSYAEAAKGPSLVVVLRRD